MDIKTLCAIQQKLKAPKGQYNPHGKYNYRSCEDILSALKPILAEYNAAILIEDELVMIGTRYYVKATVRLVDDKGEIKTSAYAREDESWKGMTGSQLTGSTSSYARKYALNALMAVDDTKDADALNDTKKQNDPSITDICTQAGVRVADLCVYYGINKVQEMDEDRMNHFFANQQMVLAQLRGGQR